MSGKDGKTKRGGARPGAGRPKNKEPLAAYGVRLPVSIVNQLKEIGPDRVKATLIRLANRVGDE